MANATGVYEYSTCVRLYVRVCVYIYICMYIYIAYIPTYISTYIFTQAVFKRWLRPA